MPPRSPVPDAPANGIVTLLYAVKDDGRNNAVVVQEYLRRWLQMEAWNDGAIH